MSNLFKNGKNRPLVSIIIILETQSFHSSSTVKYCDYTWLCQKTKSTWNGIIKKKKKQQTEPLSTVVVFIDLWRPTDRPAPSGLSPCTGPHHSESLHPNPLQPTFIRWVAPCNMTAAAFNKQLTHILHMCVCVCVRVCVFYWRPIWLDSSVIALH